MFVSLTLLGVLAAHRTTAKVFTATKHQILLAFHSYSCFDYFLISQTAEVIIIKRRRLLLKQISGIKRNLSLGVLHKDRQSLCKLQYRISPLTKPVSDKLNEVYYGVLNTARGKKQMG